MASVFSKFKQATHDYGNEPALATRVEDVFQKRLYEQLYTLVQQIGRGLIELGVRPYEHVTLISENRIEFLPTFLSVMGIQGVTVPRGSTASTQDLEHIINHSNSETVIVENMETLDRIRSVKTPKVRRFIVIEGERRKDVLTLQDVINKGRAGNINKFEERQNRITEEDLLTVVYTSGQSGIPKGVMLTHDNILHQLTVLPPLVDLKYTDRIMAIMPPWHMLELIVELLAITTGASISYTQLKGSRPVPSVMMENLKIVKPTFLASVPSLWENVYNGFNRQLRQKDKESPGTIRKFNLFYDKIALPYALAQAELRGEIPRFEQSFGLEKWIRENSAKIRVALTETGYIRKLYEEGNREALGKLREALGGELRGAFSGGAALPKHVENMLLTAGINVFQAYGLTETSPVITARHFADNTLYTVGKPVAGTEIRIVKLPDSDKPFNVAYAKDVNRGEEGFLIVKGRQVFKGYYDDPDKTRSVLTRDGWFNTGDIVKMTTNGSIVYVDREGDFINLTGGEKIPPLPIEQALESSPYIKQAMIVGDGKDVLGALLVPDMDYCTELSIGNSIDDVFKRGYATFETEINALVSISTGFRPFERIHMFRLVEELPMTQTLKVQKRKAKEMYKSVIEEMYKR
jgi:long-chain acyl-CoA synthetase